MIHENSLNNLKPLQAGTERTKEIASAGGSVCSEAKSMARRMSWLKRKGMNDVQIQELHDMLTNEDVSDITLLSYIKTLKEMADTDGDFNKVKGVVELLLKWRKERFGSKVKVEAEIKVDWSQDVDRILEACVVVDTELTNGTYVPKEQE